MSEKRASKRNAICGYCGMEVIYQNLKNHCKFVHEKPPLVKGQQLLFGSSSTPKNTSTASSSEFESIQIADIEQGKSTSNSIPSLF